MVTIFLFVSFKRLFFEHFSTNDETFTNDNDLLSLERDVKCIPCDNNGSFLIQKYKYILNYKTIWTFSFSISSIRSPTQDQRLFSLSIINAATPLTTIVLASRCSITCHQPVTSFINSIVIYLCVYQMLHQPRALMSHVHITLPVM